LCARFKKGENCKHINTNGRVLWRVCIKALTFLSPAHWPLNDDEQRHLQQSIPPQTLYHRMEECIVIENKYRPEYDDGSLVFFFVVDAIPHENIVNMISSLSLSLSISLARQFIKYLAKVV
jgi:hypothetical protein